MLITALGALSLHYVPFDLNPLHLQNPTAESVVWEYKLIQDSKYSTSYGALATASLEELAARSEALKRLPTVSHVESILSFLPQQVEAKRLLLRRCSRSSMPSTSPGPRRDRLSPRNWPRS